MYLYISECMHRNEEPRTYKGTLPIGMYAVSKGTGIVTVFQSSCGVMGCGLHYVVLRCVASRGVGKGKLKVVFLMELTRFNVMLRVKKDNSTLLTTAQNPSSLATETHTLRQLKTPRNILPESNSQQQQRSPTVALFHGFFIHFLYCKPSIDLSCYIRRYHAIRLIHTWKDFQITSLSFTLRTGWWVLKNRAILSETFVFVFAKDFSRFFISNLGFLQEAN